MHCLKSLRTANPGILQLFKNAGISARVGADSIVLSRSQKPVPLPCWASASPHIHRALHHQKGPDVDQGHSNRSRLMSSIEDLLFYTISEGKEMIPLSQFISALRKTGLLTSDPRLHDCVHQMRQLTRDSIGPVMMDKKLFRRCVGNNIMLLTKAFRKKFIIPNFEEFSQQINKMYDSAQQQKGGHVADYIPQLAKFSPDLWGVSLCTIDGQRHSVGDTKVPFCLQSCVKPLEYAIAVHEIGSERVHHFVGKEPSGFKFNKLSLSEEGQVQQQREGLYVYGIMGVCVLLANYSLLNRSFQSERETGDRNYAIGYYLKEKKLCSIEVTCESGSVMAATLANGGICPITGERVLSAEAVRNTLSLMHSCGMYDFSGQFAFHVGLPAKSGVSGAVLMVVPNVMGMMCWSPPLDRLGNSVRGIHFCQELVSHFNFHNYDNLRHFTKKHDPRRRSDEDPNKSVVNLMFAAYSGDVSALRRFALSALNMEQRDYDSRTALHIAAAEGHVEAVIFLTEICKVNPHMKDRWGNTPLDDAIQFGHNVLVSILQEYQSVYTDSNSPCDTDEQKSTLDTLKGIV
ncbi:hypothetical protein PAMP_012279 [Pampus punctatissimus]